MLGVAMNHVWRPSCQVAQRLETEGEFVAAESREVCVLFPEGRDPAAFNPMSPIRGH
jgi:hypothetical protein